MTDETQALARYQRGDFAGARAAARAVAAAPPSPEAEAAARDLLARLAPDPWAARLAIGAAALLALMVGLYVA